VERAARPPGPPLGIERVSDRERVGIDFDDRVQRRTAAVERLDA
jgi:hypothetical protein